MKVAAVLTGCVLAFFGFSWISVWLHRVADLMPHGDVTAVQAANQWTVGCLSIASGFLAAVSILSCIGIIGSVVEKIGSRSFEEVMKARGVKP